MKLLHTITQYLLKNPLSEKIENRFFNDLNISFTRLKTGQYEYHDYSGQNTFRVDERTKDFFLYMDSYAEAGKTWAKILKNLEFSHSDSIVDICAGWAPKVTLWCYYAGFTWTVYLLDKDTASIKILKNFMKLFNTKYVLRCLPKDIRDTKQKFSFCIANHIIDDILLNSFCKKESIDEKKVYNDEKTLKYIWKQIYSDDSLKEETTRFIAKSLDKITKKWWILCISQYQSMMESILDLWDSVEISCALLQQVVKILTKDFWYKDISKSWLRWIHKKNISWFYILKKIKWLKV